MGKASKWFRALLGLRKPDSSRISSCAPSQTPVSSSAKPPPPKKKWNFVKSFREKENHDHYDDHDSLSGRASAANTTSSSTVASGPREQAGMAAKGCRNHEEWAVVKIQSHFRAYLSRRALRALKSLVKLQALIRGQIVRKHTSVMLRSMTLELLQIQASSRSQPLQIIESPLKSNQLHFLSPVTPEKFEHAMRSRSMKHGENSLLWRNGYNPKSNVAVYHDKLLKGPKWKDSPTELRPFELEEFSFRTNSGEDENCTSILDLYPKRSYTTPTRRNLFYSSHLSFGPNQRDHTLLTSKQSTQNPIIGSPSCCEFHSPSPELYLAPSRSGHGSMFGPLTPTKSDSSRSCMSCNSDQPNYRAYTASSKAKIRSLSAPKQRPQFERSSSTTKRYSLHGNVNSRINNQRVSSAVNANFTSKAYPGSGRLDRLGMPHREQAIGFSGYLPRLY